MDGSRQLLVCSVLLFLSPVSWLNGESIGAFRGYKWGSSRSAVAEAQGQADYVEDGLLMYDGLRVGPHDAKAFFLFDEIDRLVRGFYSFTENSYSPTRALQDYRDLNQRLREVYGPVDVDEEIWSRGRRFLERANGNALIRGDLILLTGWTDSRGSILHIIQQANSGSSVAHALFYWSSRFTERELEEWVAELKSGGL